MKQRHKTIPAAMIVVCDEGRILLQRRLNTGFRDGDYEVAAGHVEKGETALDTAVRELREETGLVAKPENFELFHIVTNDSETPDRQYLYMFFRLKLSDCEGEFAIMEPTKCDDMRMFNLSDLPENLVPCDLLALKTLRDSGVAFSNQ